MHRFHWLLSVLVVFAGAAFAADPLASSRRAHPRLLCDEAGFAAMIEAAKSDPLRAKLHRQIVAAAESHLEEPPIAYVLVGPRMLDQSRRALGCITTGAMAFRLTGDARFADNAKRVMLDAAAFPDWNPSHFLDVAEMATALGLGYDWLYDQLTEPERTTIKRALLDKALAYSKYAYARADPERISFPFVKGNLTNNWNQVCNGGFLVAALALAEDEPEIVRQVVAGLRDTLPHAMAAYEPDGAYPEGPVYWGYGTRYNVLILAALESALGDDFGLGALSAFDRTALFRVQVQSPTGLSFNFADGRPGMGADPGLTWLGQRYGHPAAVARSRRLLADALERDTGSGDRFLALHAVWFPEEPAEFAPLPLDVRFDGPSKVAIFRGAWGDPRALWTGLKAGSNRVNHGHLDAGSFMLDADGVRWAVDLGPDGYDLPGYWSGATIDDPRWQYYRLNNRSHNTIAPGGALQSPDADAPILAFGSTPERAFAIADLTSAYPEHAKSFRRGVALLDRARVLVQDEVTGLKPGTPLRWQMATTADVSIDREGRVATLTQNGRTLRVEILAPAAARFAVEPARPPTTVENQNEGIVMLVAGAPENAKQETDVCIAILNTPIGRKWPAPAAPALTPLADWK